MPLEDHAIVVGIQKYPELGAGNNPLNLHGPVRDADDIIEWLTSAQGGGLKKRNVKRLVSKTRRAFEPSRQAIEDALISYYDRAQRFGTPIGRRLYIYMSGHGFSPARNKGCLFAANAREKQSYNVHATAWLAWFQEAGYFREFVLWMDCCMDRMSFVPAGDPVMPPLNSPDPPGPSFVAFAARRPLKAAEVQVPPHNHVQGAFTWALLDGLKGAAVDSNGRVTGRSLADWLRQSVRSRMQAHWNDFDFAKEPEIVSEDAGVIFARGIPPKTYGVTISAPGAPNNAAVQIWAGAPPRIEHRAKLEAGLAKLTLTPGLYHCETTDGSHGASFEVVIDCTVELKALADPVKPAEADRLFTLEVNPPDATPRITVIDRRFCTVDRGDGMLSTPLPFGLFKVRISTGRNIDDEVVMLDADSRQADRAVAMPDVSTVAPIAWTTSTREYQKAAMDRMDDLGKVARRDSPAKATSSISLLARAFSGARADGGNSEPWANLSIVDRRGNSLLDPADGEVHRDGDPYALATVAVAPGDYYLRHKLDDGAVIEQSLIVPDGWSLEAHVLRRVLAGGDFDFRPRVSVHMIPNAGKSNVDLRVLELARTALGDEQPILGDELAELLVRKFHNPIAGLLGGHLLLLAHEAGRTVDLSMLNEVVRNLRGLVGDAHPDVEALALRCPDVELRPSRPIRIPPMYQRSWRLLTEASYVRSTVVSTRLARRLIAPSALPPFLVWSVDEDTRACAVEALKQATWGARTFSDALHEAVFQQGATPTALAADVVVPAMALAMVADAVRPRTGPTLSPKSSADRRLARERASRLNLPASTVAHLARELKGNGGYARPEA